MSKRKFQAETDEAWTSFSREQLIQRCQQLEKHVEQLRNTIVKATGKETHEKKFKGKQSTMRPFDFSKHGKRHIFLKFFYLGWDYHVRTNETDQGHKRIVLVGFCRSRNDFANSGRFLV